MLKKNVMIMVDSKKEQPDREAEEMKFMTEGIYCGEPCYRIGWDKHDNQNRARFDNADPFRYRKQSDVF